VAFVDRNSIFFTSIILKRPFSKKLLGEMADVPTYRMSLIVSEANCHYIRWSAMVDFFRPGFKACCRLGDGKSQYNGAPQNRNIHKLILGLVWKSLKRQ
jgi:hypothetical protein